jgi:hypothetical protein
MQGRKKCCVMQYFAFIEKQTCTFGPCLLVGFTSNYLRHAEFISASHRTSGLHGLNLAWGPETSSG